MFSTALNKNAVVVFIFNSLTKALVPIKLRYSLWAVDVKIRSYWNLRLVTLDSTYGVDLVQPPDFSNEKDNGDPTNWSEYYKPVFVKVQALSASFSRNYKSWLW